jgi:hypothetical protein
MLGSRRTTDGVRRLLNRVDQLRDRRGPIVDQPHDDRGRIADPVMVCPVCQGEFRATGMEWLGAVRVGECADASEEEIDAWTDAFVNSVAAADEEHPGRDGVPAT